MLGLGGNAVSSQVSATSYMSGCTLLQMCGAYAFCSWLDGAGSVGVGGRGKGWIGGW
jgi:hypothetical protein